MRIKEEIILTNNWEFRKSGEDMWKEARVPGNIHLDLLNQRFIEDPFVGENAKTMEWIEEENWEYRTIFEVPEHILAKNVVELVFDGLDTFATVYLNGIQLLKTDNMFRQYKSSIKGRLENGENELRIIFHSAYKKGLELLEKHGFQLSAANDTRAMKVSPYIRKAPYHFGWDWGPRLVTCGIWRKVHIEAWDMAQIESIQVIQKNLNPCNGHLQIIADIHSIRKYDANILIHVDNEVIQNKPVSIKEGTNKYSFDFHIENPRLWWPNGMGEPNLYALKCELKKGDEPIDSLTEQVGLRTVELIREPDKLGSSFKFEVNGQELFIKGANIIPLDYFHPRVTPDKYEAMIDAALDANMNMLRVWGGAAYEEDYFYELCDKKGLLIWQDFMFACCMYPANEEFLDTVREEVIYNVTRLRNHPCIAIWCGNNELHEAFHTWGWKEEMGTNAVKAWEDYKTLFYDVIPNLLKELAPVKQYWPSSPAGGYDDLLSLRSGDYHYWKIIKEDLPISVYKENVGRFMSEYGFKGYPALETIKTYAEEDDFDFRSPVMEYHQGWDRGADLVELNMKREYQWPKDFYHFVYLSQVMQAYAMKVAIEAHRRNKPYCMGTLYWQLNDVWPSATWASIDYYGRWKALHYEVKKAFQNLLITFDLLPDHLNMFLISDSLEPLYATLSISLMDFNGKHLDTREIDLQLPPNSNNCVFETSLEELIGKHDEKRILLHAALKNNNELLTENTLYFLPVKELELPAPDIKHEITREGSKTFIQISSSTLVKNLYINNKEENLVLGDNFFDLLPGREYKLEVVSGNRNIKKDQLILTSIYNTYQT